MVSDKYAAELKIALDLHRGGAVKEAADMYRTMLASHPASFDLQHYLGMALMQTGQLDQAIVHLQKATSLNSKSAAAFCNLGIAYDMRGYADHALGALDQAIAIKPDFAEPWVRKAAVLHLTGRIADSIDVYKQATLLRRDSGLFNNYGAALRDLSRYDEALNAFASALEIKPDYAAAMVNRGNTLRDMGRAADAIEDYDRALALHPDHADAIANRARAVEEAAGRALTQEHAGVVDEGPGKVDRYEVKSQSKGLLQNELLAYAREFAANPDIANRPELRHHVMMKLSDWSAYDVVTDILDAVRKGERPVHPFLLVAVPCTAQEHMLCAKKYAAATMPARKSMVEDKPYSHDKIRVAYLSNDFFEHATAYLMAGLFEAHDRTQFEWTALSYNPPADSAMRRRLESGFDHFIDISGMDDIAVARLIREREIDILVDLKGYTAGTRTEILSYRPAPVQMAYLGYPGTTGAPFVDYAIVDRYVVSAQVEPFFTEKLVFMPDSYQVNDNKREIAARPRREDIGLPADAFVFCSFNNNYKITPDMFDVWMRILQRTDNSVLWVYKGAAVAEANLKEEAHKRGVDPARLIFAEHAPQSEHLARLGCADLFLDTLPCNAHTTASDALWGGLPVLTVSGETFAGRVAGSILQAANLPELIAPDVDAYEEMAVAFAQSPDSLKMIKDKLVATRDVMPLFDTARFARYIEDAYRQAYARYQAGLELQNINVGKL